MARSSILDLNVFDLANRVLETLPEEIAFEDFGSYRLLKAVGKGGMGEVLLADDTASGRRVAIKFLRNVWTVEPELRRYFNREIQTLAKLEHPYIGRLYEMGVHPSGTPYYVLEFIEGKPLDQYCKERECSLDARLRLFRLICEAVQYAHSRAVVHLDLKPANILVKEDGTPRLLDFGIARHLQNSNESVDQTQVRFTPAYAAPEQIRREPVGTFTDVYALGVVLYELVSGKHPYTVAGRTASEVEAIMAGPQEPRNPSDSRDRVMASKAEWRDLDVLCLKAMRKEVPERYHSVMELTQELDRFLRTEPLIAKRAKRSYRIGKFLRRNRRILTALSAVLVLIGGLVVFYTIRLANARDAALAQVKRTQRTQQFMLSMFGGDVNAAPASDLRVVDILDRGVNQANLLSSEPTVQAELYYRLGGIYQNLGNLDRADSLLRSALEIRKSVLRADDPEIAESLVALGLLRIDQARYSDAEQLLREAIHIDKWRLSADDTRLGDALTALGSSLQHKGAYSEAIKVLNEAVRIQSLPGADRASLVQSLTYLAIVHYVLGHDSETESLDRRILGLDRQIYGNRHPSVAEDLANLGTVQEQMGLYTEAERNERRALEMDRAWYGKEQIEVALVEEVLAGTLIYEHQLDEATRLLQRALSTQEHDLGKAHPFVALALNELGVIALKRGDLNEAQACFRRMADIYRSTFGEHDRHVALGKMRFGELYLAKNEYPRSEQFFRQSIQVFSQVLSPNHVFTGTARIELGRVLLRQHRYQEAAEQLLTGYQIVAPGRSATLEAEVNARKDLISVYGALSMPAQAAKFEAEQMATERVQNAGAHPVTDY